MQRCLTAFSVLAVASTSLSAFNLPGEEIRLPRSSRGLPVVVVGVGASTLRMGLDTGTSRTMLSSEAASRLNLSPRQRLSIGCAAAPPRAGFCGAPPALELAGLPLVADCVGWLPEEKHLAGAEDLDGVLGADLIAQVDVWIDLRSTPVKARFARPGSLAPLVTGTRIAVESIGRRPSISARVAGLRRDGPEARLVVDSGSDGLVLFGQIAQRTLTLLPHDRIDGRLQTVLARRDVKMVSLSGVRIGGSLFVLPAAGLLASTLDRTEDGLLPLTALSPVLLDLSNGVIIANARLR